MSKIYSFPAIVDQNSRILILGSMPGVESLRKQEYYAHPRNQFWRIIFDLYQQPVPDNYQEKVSFLKAKGIGLWDVIESCYREGSSDAKIKQEKVNDIQGLLNEFPQIKRLYFNGTKAYDTYKRYFGFSTDLIYERLESTSPANTKSYARKLQDWSKIKRFC
ncbi:MAG: DNA-deoxyinosine glycosylase [Peptococcia bacterium]